MKIAMIGTRGVPARYGGFETCVEEVGRRLVKRGHDVTVYCRGTRPEERLDSYEGMRLVHLPALRRKALETPSHTALSLAHLSRHTTDVALVFNAANAPLLPLLRSRGIPVATHVDGLEWQRSKWQGAGRRFYRYAESLAVRWSDALIADAKGIADYYTREFGTETVQIAYGAPLVDGGRQEMLDRVELRAHGYHLVVARFEPENHVDVIVRGYSAGEATKPLVVVGSAPYSDGYTRRVHALADERVRFLGGVWDQRLLDQLYANCATYLHGHSVGGTNPSLLRAIGAGAATIAYDVSFNREVLQGSGRYFRTPDDVASALEFAEADPDRTRRDGEQARLRAAGYDWDDVAADYETLCRRLAARDFPRVRPSGRRLRSHPATPGTAQLPVDQPVPGGPPHPAVRP